MILSNDFDTLVIEVGANKGTDTNKYAEHNNVIVFEPNPILYAQLIEKFRERKNVLILPFAVDLRNDVCEFNVSDAGDCGVGSLYDFDDEFLKSHIGQHSMFQAGFIYKHRTLSIRLDSLMSMWRIDHIDFLHIDAQGSDFRVIQSLGDKISRVREGQCECTYKIPLYKDCDQFNNYEDCIAYLKLHGFDAEVKYIHNSETECDIFFKRR